MTEAERQTVIDALERAASTCFTAYAHHEFMSDPKHFMHEALAIMRREREPQIPVDVQTLINATEMPTPWKCYMCNRTHTASCLRFFPAATQVD